MTAPTGGHGYRHDVTNPLFEVPVYVGILRASAELLQLLGEFLSEADAMVRTQLGRFVADRQPMPAIRPSRRPSPYTS